MLRSVFAVFCSVGLVSGLVSDHLFEHGSKLKLSFQGYITMAEPDGSKIYTVAYNMDNLCSAVDPKKPENKPSKDDKCFDVPLLFIHGAYRGRLNFDDVVEYMFAEDKNMEKYPMIFVDIRGNGLSQNIENEQTFDRWTNDFIEILQYFDVESADWLGISSGGMITIYAAIHYPDYVNRIATIAAAPKLSLAAQYLMGTAMAGIVSFDPPDNTTLELQEFLLDSINTLAAAGYISQSLADVSYALARNLHYAEWFATFAALLGLDETGATNGIDKNAFIICDSADWLMDSSDCLTYAADVTGEVTLLEYDIGHYVWAAAAPYYAPVLAQWIVQT